MRQTREHFQAFENIIPFGFSLGNYLQHRADNHPTHHNIRQHGQQAALGVILLAVLAYLVMRWVIVGAVLKLISKTESKRDDIFKRLKVFSRLSHLAPGLVIYSLGPAVFDSIPWLAELISKVSLVYIAVMVVLLVDALLSAGLMIYRTYPISKTFPITSFVQIAKLILYFFGAIAVLSVILGESPLTFLAGFGALTAVLMLVFKDPILGFVAGIQLSANKMLAVGDWIEMPKYGVDGDIMEIALTTVKIRNFDKTITTCLLYTSPSPRD